MSVFLQPDLWPFVVLLSSVALVVGLITRFSFHPFVALTFSAVFVGLISPELPQLPGQHPLVTAIELPMAEFGLVAGKIAWVIALAAVTGFAMMESGAAETIVNTLLKVFGEKLAALAFLVSGFVLSIPVFFDTVFFLLIPLAVTLALKTGKNYVLYVMAIGGGAGITHSLIPPTPGPMIMAQSLNLEMGITILAGLAVAILPAMSALVIGGYLNRKMPIAVRVADKHVIAIANKPHFLSAILPVALPLILIATDAILKTGSGGSPGWVAFLGNKNVAMLTGAVIALWLWAGSQKLAKRELWQEVAKPLEIAGVIILITSAGGAYGAMIRHSGIGDAIGSATTGLDVNYILLAWMTAAVIKTAQGSGTVAMITSAAILASIIAPEALVSEPVLDYHPVYILLAIGFGSLVISWMNDSGFWIVSRMSGFTTREALQTWSLLLAGVGLVGLVQLLILSRLFPLI
ncbi:MAG: SLC13 family permease [Halieaceae bacterium]